MLHNRLSGGRIFCMPNIGVRMPPNERKKRSMVGIIEPSKSNSDRPFC